MQHVRTTDKRDSNLELLRIIMMILIVAHHFAHHGGFSFSSDTVSLNRLWIQFITIGGKLGVDVFVLISGYFLIGSAGYRTVRSVRMWFQLLTYSLVPFCVLALLKQVSFTSGRLIQSMLPVSYDCWWFASAYFILYILTPFLNRFLHAMSKTEYRKYLLALTILWCVIPTLLHVEMQRNNLLWFVCLYSAIGYYRLHHHSAGRKGSTCIILAIVILLLTYTSVIVLDLIGRNSSFVADHAMFLYGYDSIPIVIAALLLVIGFSRINLKHSGFINTVSAATFGVYLIHDNPYIRSLLWEKLFGNASHADSRLLIPYSMLVILAVFIACTAIELVRIHTVEKHCGRFYASVAGRIDRMVDRVLSSRKSGGSASSDAAHEEGDTNEHQD